MAFIVEELEFPTMLVGTYIGTAAHRWKGLSIESDSRLTPG